jgi:hypothetical protein
VRSLIAVKRTDQFGKAVGIRLHIIIIVKRTQLAADNSSDMRSGAGQGLLIFLVKAGPLSLQGQDLVRGPEIE